MQGHLSRLAGWQASAQGRAWAGEQGKYPLKRAQTPAKRLPGNLARAGWLRGVGRLGALWEPYKAL